MRDNWGSLGVKLETKERFDAYKLKLQTMGNSGNLTTDEVLDRLLNMAGAEKPNTQQREEVNT